MNARMWRCSNKSQEMCREKRSCKAKKTKKKYQTATTDFVFFFIYCALLCNKLNVRAAQTMQPVVCWAWKSHTFPTWFWLLLLVLSCRVTACSMRLGAIIASRSEKAKLHAYQQQCMLICIYVCLCICVCMCIGSQRALTDWGDVGFNVAHGLQKWLQCGDATKC